MSATTGKTLLFLCRCGNNIANNVDLEAIQAWAERDERPEAVVVHNLLCSPDGRKAFREALAGHGPDRVVVAACSPKMHEKTFMTLAEEAGLNMATVHLANIREQCGWVTKDRAAATAKACALVRAALRRSARAEALERRHMEVRTDLLVIGGGIAGVEAALTASRAGRKVTIVEREISLGGNVIKVEEVAPNMECAPCLLAPRLAAVREDPNIRVVTNAEVREVVGFYGNFTVRVLKKARFVEDSCIGCEACFEACPVSTPSPFHLGLGTRKAVHTLFAGSVPAAAAIDQAACRHFADGACNACVEACPFGSINFGQKDEELVLEAGAIIVATGAASGEAVLPAPLGRGRVADVYTTPEFERLASSNGPFGSAIQCKDGRKPAAVAVVHCAGSLRPDGLPYCSGVCCVNALKVGEQVRKQVPEAIVYDLHRDLVFPSPAAQAFREKQVAHGTRLVPCADLASVRVSSADGRIRVEGAGFEPLTVDLVVLSTGLAPASGTPELAALLNADLGAHGFLAPAHPLLKETETTIDGVYLAGCAAGPCSVSTAVTRAQAAAGDAAARLQPGRRIDLEVMTACIEETTCGGCKLCLAVCPYKAISFDKAKKVSRVNEAICRGCGTCAAQCPSGAARARHFTDAQLKAEVGGLFA